MSKDIELPAPSDLFFVALTSRFLLLMVQNMPEWFLSNANWSQETSKQTPMITRATTMPSTVLELL